MEHDQRQRQEEKQRDIHGDGDGKIYCRFLCAVYPGLLLAIPARGQAISILEKHLLTALPNSH